MTSKELIEKIKHIGVEEWRIAIEKIEKDLEVLEILKILKKNMTIETDYYDSYDGRVEFEYIVCNGEPLDIENQEDFNKIKEWLENE